MRRHFLFVPLLFAFWLDSVPTAGRSPQRASQAHPDFSGQWTLDLARSRLALPFRNITRGLVKIEHRDPAFSFSRAFTANGQDSKLAWSLATDGKETTGTENGMPIRQTLTWSADTLVFLTVFQAPLGEARNLVRYTLLDGGKTLVADESFRGPRASYDNHWVFAKER